MLYRYSGLLIAGLLSACGGSSSNNTAGIDGSGAPVAKTQASSGPINGFGSVIVQGVRFDTSNAEIFIGANIASEDQLRVGDFVTVIGSINGDTITGVAEEVRLFPNVIGPATAINEIENSVTVLGQTIIVNAATVFGATIYPRSLNGLAINDLLRISGNLTANGAVLATRVDKIASNALELTGFVSELDSSNGRFRINGITVDYNSATIESDINTLQNGAFVKIKASSFNNNLLIGEELEIEDSIFGDLEDVDELEFEGFISAVIDSNNFIIGGLPMRISAATEFEGGSAADLDLGVFIEIEGELRGGIIEVEEIEFQSLPNGSVVGEVENIEVTQAGPIPSGTLVVSGQAITTTNETRYEDNSELDLNQFNLNNISVGDTLVISGTFSGSTLLAQLIEREDSDELEEIELTGPVINLGANSLSMYSFTIQVDNDTEFSIDNEDTTAANFFANSDGAIVEVEGALAGSTITAEKLDIVSEEN